MIKRPKEIENAINYLNTFDTYNPYQETWETVYYYMCKLEDTIQWLIAENERMCDDGK